MARKERKDVDYYPHLIKPGRTLKILQQRYGIKGYGFFYKILDQLAAAENHYIEVEDDGHLLELASDCLIDDIDEFKDMISIIIKTGKIDKELYEQFNVIASYDFYENIQDAYKRRRNICASIESLKQYLSGEPVVIIDESQEPEKPVKNIKPVKKKKSKESFSYGLDIIANEWHYYTGKKITLCDVGYPIDVIEAKSAIKDLSEDIDFYEWLKRYELK